jgi:hypothetical protein
VAQRVPLEPLRVVVRYGDPFAHAYFPLSLEGEIVPTKKGISVPGNGLGDLQEAIDAFCAELERTRRAKAGMRLLRVDVLLNPGGLAVGASVSPVEPALPIGPLGLDDFVAGMVRPGAGISKRMTRDRGLGSTDACGGHRGAGFGRWRAAGHRGCRDRTRIRPVLLCPYPV